MWMPFTSKVEKNSTSPCSNAARHLRGVGIEEQAREVAIDGRAAMGVLFGEDDGVAGAALDRGRRARSSPAAFLKTRMRTGSGVCRSVRRRPRRAAWRNSSKRTRVSRPAREPASVKTSKGPEANLSQESAAGSTRVKRRPRVTRRRIRLSLSSGGRGTAGRAEAAEPPLRSSALRRSPPPPPRLLQFARLEADGAHPRVAAAAVALANSRQVVLGLSFAQGFEPTEILVRKLDGLTETV